jgi:hypothetical protein
MDRCPICDVAVKPENLLRHLSETHPRHPDTVKLVEELKTDPERAPRRTAGRPFRIRRWQILLLVAVIVGGVGGYYLIQAAAHPPPFPCIGGEGGQLYHWHTQLTIFSRAAQIAIPPNIGLSAFCIEPVHTHATDGGRIHIESDVNYIYTIGDFFRVWGKDFGSPTQMLVNGSPLSTPRATVELRDGESIELHYDSFSP